MSTDIPAGLGAGFDKEIGLEFLELTPDGGTARLEIDDKLLQPWGIVHGGVYCSVVESLASVSGQVWLTENGGGHVVGVNNNTDFLRAISAGTVTAVSVPIHRGRRQHGLPARLHRAHRRQSDLRHDGHRRARRLHLDARALS